MKKHKLYSIDKQGNLNFNLRNGLLKHTYKAESFWEHPAASITIVLLCALLDFIMFKQLFGSFLYDSYYIQMLSILGLIIGFDIAPIYIGIIKKRLDSGLNASKTIALLLLTAFLIAFMCNVILRIAVRDMILPDFSSATTSTMGESQPTNNNTNLPIFYAIFGICLPAITSFVSFAVSYFSYKPLEAKLKKLKCEQIELEDSINKMEALEVEYAENENYLERMMEEDNQYYDFTKQLIERRAVLFANYVRQRLKEQLGNSTANNVLSDNTIDILKKIEELDDEYLQKEKRNKSFENNIEIAI